MECSGRGSSPWTEYSRWTVANTPRIGAVIALRQDRTGKELPPGEVKNRVQVLDVPLVSKDMLKSEVQGQLW
jgi:hypothetical protein